MHTKNCLGIHYTRTSITAVLMKKKDNQWLCADDLTLPVEPAPASTLDQNQTDDAPTPLQTTLAHLAERMQPTQRHLHPVALAIDGTLYNTQMHHSDFNNIKH